jgi:hypothetical protein
MMKNEEKNKRKINFKLNDHNIFHAEHLIGNHAY